MLVHPSSWPLDEDELNGSDAMHRLLLRWLAMLGLRRPDVEVAPLEAGEPLGLPEWRPASVDGDRVDHR